MGAHFQVKSLKTINTDPLCARKMILIKNKRRNLYLISKFRPRGAQGSLQSESLLWRSVVRIPCSETGKYRHPSLVLSKFKSDQWGNRGLASNQFSQTQKISIFCAIRKYSLFVITVTRRCCILHMYCTLHGVVTC
jgi:hypothetical protein